MYGTNVLEKRPLSHFGGIAGFNQMSSVIEEKRNFRIQVKNWLATVKKIWPRCPVEIDGDALRICVTGEDQLDVQPKDTGRPEGSHQAEAGSAPGRPAAFAHPAAV